MMRLPFPRHTPASQRGAASLVVVMVLFFLVAMVAAYTNRNLIFEQRTSVNQYRSAQAFEAAEAGLEWAMAMLNGGRIGNDCTEASALPGSTSFRQRYLSIDPSSGNISPVANLWATCVWNGAGWSCTCPAAAGGASPAAPAGTAIFPAFRVRFQPLQGTTPQQGIIRVTSNGCTRLDDACLNATLGTTVDVEGLAVVGSVIGLKSALSAPPGAALTALGDVPGGGGLEVYNTEPGRGGITVHAGGVVNNGAIKLRGIPGTPESETVAPSDSTISDLAAKPLQLFASYFSAWPAVYRQQPAIIRVDCPAGGCRAALTAAVAAHPDRVIWIDGDLTIEDAGDIGSPPDPADPTVPGPAMIVATGAVKFLAPGARIFGVVFSGSGAWEGTGQIHGAAIVTDTLSALSGAVVVYNGAVLDSLRLRSGSFVRTPGSWLDFPPPP